MLADSLEGCRQSRSASPSLTTFHHFQQFPPHALKIGEVASERDYQKLGRYFEFGGAHDTLPSCGMWTALGTIS